MARAHGNGPAVAPDLSRTPHGVPRHNPGPGLSRSAQPSLAPSCGIGTDPSCRLSTADIWKCISAAGVGYVSATRRGFLLPISTAWAGQNGPSLSHAARRREGSIASAKAPPWDRRVLRIFGWSLGNLVVLTVVEPEQPVLAGAGARAAGDEQQRHGKRDRAQIDCDDDDLENIHIHIPIIS